MKSCEDGKNNNNVTIKNFFANVTFLRHRYLASDINDMFTYDCGGRANVNCNSFSRQFHLEQQNVLQQAFLYEDRSQTKRRIHINAARVWPGSICNGKRN